MTKKYLGSVVSFPIMPICQIILTVHVVSNLTEYPNSGKEAKGQSSSNVLKKNKQELVNITHNFCQPFEDLNLRNK